MILANPSDWRKVVPMGVLSHTGTYTFLFLTDEDGPLPQATRDYLGVLEPTWTHPSEQVSLFAQVVGGEVPNATVQGFSDVISVADDIPSPS